MRNVAYDTQTPLSLSICAVKSSLYTRENIPLRIAFENVSNGKLKILRRFRPVPVFFSIHMARTDGTPINIPGAGKISFQKDSIEYLELNTKEIFGFQINIADLVTSSNGITEGDYELSITYHNQYGDGCFRGKINSNSINVKIGD